MTGGALLLLMLLASWASLMLQAAAMTHLWRQRASYDAEKIAGRGYVRTAACRVLAAVIYVSVALLQAAGVQVPGAGGLSPEALVVFTGVQVLWITNAALDIRLRGQLRRRSEEEGRDG